MHSVSSVSFPSFFSSSFGTSAVGTTGDNPDNFFSAFEPPWCIWFIAKAPWSFIICALLAIDGISFSVKARGWHGNVIPSWLTAVAPRIYKPTSVALTLRYSASPSLIVPSSLDENKVKGAIESLLGTSTL